MAKCLVCGIELVKPEDFSSGDLSKNLCAQCRKPRVSQKQIKPWQDTLVHNNKFGKNIPANEMQVHAAYKEKLKQEGKNEQQIKKALQKWHKEQAA